MAITLDHLFYQITTYFPVANLQETPQVFKEVARQIRHEGQQELHELLGDVSASRAADHFHQVRTIKARLLITLTVIRECIVAFLASSACCNRTHGMALIHN